MCCSVEVVPPKGAPWTLAMGRPTSEAAVEHTAKKGSRSEQATRVSALNEAAYLTSLTMAADYRRRQRPNGQQQPRPGSSAAPPQPPASFNKLAPLEYKQM